MSTLTGDAERQPLLAAQQQSDQGSQPVANLEIPTSADASTPDAVEQTTYVRSVIWYIILVSGGALALVFLIKGFIDAGDADVSPL
jgi:hypothetical protein